MRTVAEAFRGSIARLAPDLLDEMRGVADGAAVGGEAWKDEGRTVDILDIVAMNARSEIALGQWDDGCTAIAWRFPENASGGPKQILAQNWDWREAVGKNLAMASIAREGKPKIWMVIEVRVAGRKQAEATLILSIQPGIVGKIGFNSSSVGVCLNAIRARPISFELLPIHLLLRLALESDSVADAIAAIERVGGAASCASSCAVAGLRGGRAGASCFGAACDARDGRRDARDGRHHAGDDHPRLEMA